MPFFQELNILGFQCPPVTSVTNFTRMPQEEDCDHLLEMLNVVRKSLVQRPPTDPHYPPVQVAKWHSWCIHPLSPECRGAKQHLISSRCIFWPKFLCNAPGSKWRTAGDLRLVKTLWSRIKFTCKSSFDHWPISHPTHVIMIGWHIAGILLQARMMKQSKTYISFS